LDFFFHRRALAQQLAGRILSTAVLAPARSGLFLAAPRRTGKSTFLREDLIPELEQSGATVLYIDLWADKAVDPGQAIVSLVRSALGAEDGLVLRAARRAGLDKLVLAGLTFDVAKVGLGTGVTLSMALAALSDAVKRPIVLIIDEAQHAATTRAGADALFALKAARDELNSTRHCGLRIVATGSSQAKLALMRASKDQAFFKASLQPFPPLDVHYVDWFIENSGLPARLDAIKTFELFKRAGSRPEVLVDALGSLEEKIAEVTETGVDDLFEAAVTLEIRAAELDALHVVDSLTPLQGAVLRVLAAQADAYVPYAAATMTAYRRALDQLQPESTVNIDVPNIQTALDNLQEKGLVWKAARGEYALEEQSLVDLMKLHGRLG
jgi:hypothetical protein